MANANPTLPDLLRERLRAAPQQRLPWAEVMQMALYEPGFGYYRRGVRRIGRGGDFYTSVSVGPLFGALIAEFAHQEWQKLGKPDCFTLIEQGAHDGTLAHDVLQGCRAISEAFFAAVRCVILEPDETLRAAQRACFGGEFKAKLHHDTEACAGPGLFCCNELLDAFPVHRVRWDGSRWRETFVIEDESSPHGFGFVEDDLVSGAVLRELGSHGPELPDGWTTEVCPAMVDWLDGVARLPFTGSMLILDYGFTEEEHFAPERSDGTLRRYLNHRMDGRVLEDLGDADLTAHVDFTRVSELARTRGFTEQEFTEQGRFLTRLFVDAFARHGRTPDAATQRQFHTLTHPGHMGRQFHALVLRR